MSARAQVVPVVRQHGAMEGTEAPVDLDAVRLYRLRRVREALARHDYAGIVLFDQLNTRYATDVTCMQLWCLHNEHRYVFVPAEGPVVVFEYGNHAHLSEDVPTVDEVRPSQPFYYFAAGHRYEEMAARWAREIADLVTRHGGGNRRVALDRSGPLGVHALVAEGLTVHEGFELMEQARAIKSWEEIVLMRHAIDVCELGMTAMRQAMHPGITENALWAKLHEANIANGGEWIETRLLSSGPRTNPWFKESSMRVIEAGDMVSFDTDLIGPYGYCSDISRSWICGDVAPSDEQRLLHSLALEQIQHNTALIRPGATARELAEQAWPIPERYLANRYGSIIHGVGLCDEHPAIAHLVDRDHRGYDCILEPGMVLCVESYIGAAGGHEGVKLEEQVLVTEEGVEQLSGFPLGLEGT